MSRRHTLLLVGAAVALVVLVGVAHPGRGAGPDDAAVRNAFERAVLADQQIGGVETGRRHGRRRALPARRRDVRRRRT